MAMECLSSPAQLECDALLLCEESLHSLRTIGDPVLQTDRVMEQMLSQEEMVVINPNYMSTTQLGKVTESKRRELVSSMAQVCEEHAASLHILPMAVNYLDRVLSCSRISEDELDLSAMACVLIASKLNNSEGIPLEKLCHHVFFTSRQLLDMELLVLSKLKWDLYTITPYDFIDFLLPRLHLNETNRKRFYSLVQHFIQICCREYHFVVYPPSLIAAGCMVASARLLNIENPSPSKAFTFRDFLASLVNVEEEFISACQEQVEDYYRTGMCNSELPMSAWKAKCA